MLGTARPPLTIAEVRDSRDGALHSELRGVLSTFAAHFQALGSLDPTNDAVLRGAREDAARRVAELSAANSTAANASTPLNDCITAEEVRRALARASSRKAPGHDGLPVELLKYSGQVGARWMVQLFNAVLDAGTLPSQWRQGDIVPLYKRNDPTDCGNYRGITLLPACDKLFMSILANRLLDHVDAHDQQYGFVRHKGTVEALFNVITNVDAHKNAGNTLYALFLDVRKAFDKVNHDMLLARLHDAGVTGKVWSVIKRAYESTRSCVKLSGTRSDTFPLTVGVAQGCPLSPVLFIIYMYPLLEDANAPHRLCNGVVLPGACEHLHGAQAPEQPAPPREGTGMAPAAMSAQCFADDALAASTQTGLDSTESPGLQRTIDGFHAQKRRYDWEINVQKSQVLVIGTPVAPPQFAWGDATLPVAESEVYLGVHISESGSWDRHMREKLSAGRTALARWRPLLRNPAVTVLVKALAVRTHVLTKLLYGMEVVSPATSQELAAEKCSNQFVHLCLYEMFGIAAGVNASRLQRCVKTDVLLLDSALVSFSEAVDVAHLRLAAKTLPPAPAGVNAEPAAGLTTMLRASLPGSHPWRSRVDRAAATYIPDRDVRPPVQHGVPVEPSHCLMHASNATLNAAVHRRRITALSDTVGAGTRTPQRPRRSKRPAKAGRVGPGSCAQLRPLQDALSRAEPGKPAAYVSCPPNVALPFAALRSGHLLAEADWPDARLSALHTLHGDCCCCGQALSALESPDAQTTSWLMIWHLLTACSADVSSRDNLRGFLRVHHPMILMWMRDLPEQHDSMRAHLDQLAAVWGIAAGEALPQDHHLPVIQYFLAFLMDPVGALRPPVYARDALHDAVACFLRHDFVRLPCSAGRVGCSSDDDGESSGSDDDSHTCSSVCEPAMRCLASVPVRICLSRPQRNHTTSSTTAWGRRRVPPSVPSICGRRGRCPPGSA